MNPYQSLPCRVPSCLAAVGATCTRVDGAPLALSHGARRSDVWRQAKNYVFRVRVRVPVVAGKFRRGSVLLVKGSGNPERYEIICDMDTGEGPPPSYTLPDRKSFTILGFVAPLD